MSLVHFINPYNKNTSCSLVFLDGSAVFCFPCTLYYSIFYGWTLFLNLFVQPKRSLNSIGPLLTTVASLCGWLTSLAALLSCCFPPVLCSVCLQASGKRDARFPHIPSPHPAFGWFFPAGAPSRAAACDDDDDRHVTCPATEPWPPGGLPASQTPGCSPPLCLQPDPWLPHRRHPSCFCHIPGLRRH